MRWRACNPHWGKPSNWFSICYSVAVWHCGSWLFPSYTLGETSCTTKAFLPNKSLVLSHWMPDPFPWLETVGVSEDGVLWLSNPSDDEDCIFHAGHHFWPKFSVTGQRPTAISWGYWHGLISIPLGMFAQSFTSLTHEALPRLLRLTKGSCPAICHTEGTSHKWKKLWYHCVPYQRCHFWSSMDRTDLSTFKRALPFTSFWVPKDL